MIRVGAADVEAIAVKAIRGHLIERGPSDATVPESDGELIEQHLERVVIKHRAIEIHLKCDKANPAGGAGTIGMTESDPDSFNPAAPPSTLTVPWSAAASAEVKGILHSPSPAPTVSQELRP